MNYSPGTRRRAFTLTELLVVVSIVGILTGLIFTGMHYAGRGMASQNAAIQAAKAQVARSEAEAMRVTLPPAKQLPGLPGGPPLPPVKSGAGRAATIPADFGAVPQEYVIVFSPGVTQPRMEAMRMAREYDGVVLNVFTNIAMAAVMRIPDNRYEAFRADGKIAMLSKNSYLTLEQQITPTGVSRQTSFPTLPGNQMILRRPPVVNPARNIQFGPSPISGYQMINVAIIDSGIDATHPDLNVVMALRCSDAPPDQDSTGHGTHVAGIVGARHNTVGVVGVYPSAPLWSLRVDNLDGKITTANIFQALSYVYDYSHIIRVVNMSVGGGQDLILDAACNKVAQKGVIFVASAGNTGTLAALHSPGGSAQNVVCVGSMGDSDRIPGSKGPKTSDGNDDTFATFSNWGSAVHVVAPGVDIRSTYPVAKGSYAVLSGTSMSAPHVAGYFALLLDSKTVFGRSNRNIFLSSRPPTGAIAPAYPRTIATELIPGILGDPLQYPMVNFRIQ